MELFVVTTAVFDALFPFVTSMYRQVEPIDFFSCIIWSSAHNLRNATVYAHSLVNIDVAIRCLYIFSMEAAYILLTKVEPLCNKFYKRNAKQHITCQIPLLFVELKLIPYVMCKIHAYD